jgi:hypothetical protein
MPATALPRPAGSGGLNLAAATVARQGTILLPMKHAGAWRVNVTQTAQRGADGATRAMDGTDALVLSAGEIEGAYLLEIAPQVGTRETHRVAGRLAGARPHASWLPRRRHGTPTWICP